MLNICLNISFAVTLSTTVWMKMTWIHTDSCYEFIKSICAEKNERWKTRNIS